jgi:glycosyltransferase involved in cell wall biosynthesis
MAEAAVFVLSSRFEGFPLILLEAMSKGMGVVSFDCPTGPADIVDDHRNGLLVPHEDVEGLGRAIREIVEDEELRRRMAGAAVETAQEYTIEAIGPLWEELLAELSPESERA